MEGIMRLELENVGKINAANIKLDGITVIAGENNTGKSTIGKMLFCVFSAFHRIEEQIKEERIKSISRALSSYYHEAGKLRQVHVKEGTDNRIDQIGTATVVNVAVVQ